MIYIYMVYDIMKHMKADDPRTDQCVYLSTYTYLPTHPPSYRAYIGLYIHT